MTTPEPDRPADPNGPPADPWSGSAPVPTRDGHTQQFPVVPYPQSGHTQQMPPVVVEREIIYIERPRRRKWPWVLGALALIMLCCCGSCYGVVNELGGEYPASLHVPQDVAGLERTTNGVYAAAAAVAQGQIQASGGVETAAVAVLEDPKRPDQPVIFVGGTRLIWDPSGDLNKVITQMGTDLSGTKNFPAGSQGGTLKCANAKDNERKPVVVCAWIDHGSLGIGIFYGNRPMAECAQMLVAIRAGVLSRD